MLDVHYISDGVCYNMPQNFFLGTFQLNLLLSISHCVVMTASNSRKKLDSHSFSKIKDFTSGNKKDCTGVVVSQLQQVLKLIGLTDNEVKKKRQELLCKNYH